MSHGRNFFFVIPGRAKREPGISRQQSRDSGSAPSGASRNDGVESAWCDLRGHFAADGSCLSFCRNSQHGQNAKPSLVNKRSRQPVGRHHGPTRGDRSGIRAASAMSRAQSAGIRNGGRSRGPASVGQEAGPDEVVSQLNEVPAIPEDCSPLIPGRTKCEPGILRIPDVQLHI